MCDFDHGRVHFNVPSRVLMESFSAVERMIVLWAVCSAENNRDCCLTSVAISDFDISFAFDGGSWLGTVVSCSDDGAKTKYKSIPTTIITMAAMVLFMSQR